MIRMKVVLLELIFGVYPWHGWRSLEKFAFGIGDRPSRHFGIMGEHATSQAVENTSLHFSGPVDMVQSIYFLACNWAIGGLAT